MPLYQFRCPDCRSETELVLPMNERDNPPRCQCGGTPQRQVTAASFRMIVNPKEHVRNTLNREWKTLPPEQVAIMAPGLKEPERTLF